MITKLCLIIILKTISCRPGLIFSKPLNVIKVGEFIQQIYSGEWKSIDSQMNKYISSKKGKIDILLVYNPTKNEKRLEFAFQFTDGKYLENNSVYLKTDLTIENEKQSTLNGKDIKSKAYLITNLFENTKSKNCIISSSISIKDKSGKTLDITTNEKIDIIIEGEIKSQQNCDINLNFIVEPKQIILTEIILFTIIQILSIIIGFYPFFKAMRNNNTDFAKNISNMTFLGNIMIDIVLITINITFAMRILINYFEFLL